MDLDFTHAIKMSGTMQKNHTRVCSCNWTVPYNHLCWSEAMIISLSFNSFSVVCKDALVISYFWWYLTLKVQITSIQYIHTSMRCTYTHKLACVFYPVIHSCITLLHMFQEPDDYIEIYNSFIKISTLLCKQSLCQVLHQLMYYRYFTFNNPTVFFESLAQIIWRVTHNLKHTEYMYSCT